MITLGSLFDGIGGFPYCAAISGITPVWASEVEPFCTAVTHYHFPDMIHLGDVAKISGAEIPQVDIITFGSPCQDLSVAGKQKGLSGDRSGLFHEAIRIVYEMREATNGVCPSYIVWENVPGAFSSNHGRDFQTVLSEITKADIPMPKSRRWAKAGMVRGCGITVAWRVLDAQYWGVPQRRKRIFLIGSFGNNSAQEVLFKLESVSGNFAESGKTRERIAPAAERSVNTRCYDARGNGEGSIAPTITGDHNNRITDYTTVVIQSAKFCPKVPAKTRGISFENEKAPTLRSGTVPAICAMYERSSYGGFREGCGTIRASAGKHGASSGDIVIQGISLGFKAESTPLINNKATTLVNGTRPGHCNGVITKQGSHWIIRRLTPRECERLQGYPDDWTVLPLKNDMTNGEYEFFTDIYMLDKRINGKRLKGLAKPALVKWYNKLCNDSRRYKAIGNSLAIPCALRIIGGIADYKNSENKK